MSSTEYTTKKQATETLAFLKEIDKWQILLA